MAKRIYGWKLWVNYGQGWEYEIFEDSRSEGRARLREYRENCPQYPAMLKRGYESAPEPASPTGRTDGRITR